MIVLRRCSQAASVSLCMYILWSTTYPLRGNVAPAILFKLDPLIMILTSVSERLLVSGIVLALFMLALTAVLGRFFCGWVCPLGAVIDVAGALRRSRQPDDRSNERRSRPKFIVLLALLICAAAGIQLAWAVDPEVIFARFISLNLIPGATAAADGLFAWLIQTFGFYGPVYDFYRQLTMSVLGVKVYYFAHAVLILAMFVAVVGMSLVFSRFWCRTLCPLGALYALFARRTLLRRTVQPCAQCMRCRTDCRMGAIKEDLSYAPGECVLCMDCLYQCSTREIRFGFSRGGAARRLPEESGGITRRQFLLLGALALGSAGAGEYPQTQESAPDSAGGAQEIKQVFPGRVIRPPAALRERAFLNRCVRCGNCMKVCITNGLQPALFQSGYAGIWTPQLVFEIGYCEYQCTLCGQVCPTGAIPRLSVEEKRKTRLGLARIDRALCLPWRKNKQCIVCEEHCPVSNKAIVFKKTLIDGKQVFRPYVNLDRCIGCGICQTKCPVRPVRAIKIYPVRETRSEGSIQSAQKLV